MDEEHTQFLPTLLWKINEFIGLPYSVGEVLLTGGKMATPENSYAAGIRASHSSTDGKTPAHLLAVPSLYTLAPHQDHRQLSQSHIQQMADSTWILN